jgi:hypothetical protein
MPESFEERYRELLAQPDPEQVVVLPRPIAEIVQLMRQGDPDAEDAKLVHRFYDLLASEIRSAGH